MQKDLELEIKRDCLKNFRKYADTVTVSAAICHLFKQNEALGIFMGFEPKMRKNSEDFLTPDIAVTYDNSTKGILFEIKWSLPQSPERLKNKIVELKKYFGAFINWNNSTGRVDFHDVVLICHPEDVERVIRIINKISKEPEFVCFKDIGFSIWTWVLNPPKNGERSEQLRLKKIYGYIRNIDLEDLVSKELGILVPEEVLEYLRFTYFIVKEKPPMQYLLTFLIVNVLVNPIAFTYDKNYVVNTDWIWNKAKTYITMGEQYDKKSLTIKRRWIKEALQLLVKIEIINRGDDEDSWKIPTKMFRYVRRSIQEIICEKISKRQIKQKRELRRQLSPTRISKPRPTGKEVKLTDIFKTKNHNIRT